MHEDSDVEDYFDVEKGVRWLDFCLEEMGEEEW